MIVWHKLRRRAGITLLVIGAIFIVLWIDSANRYLILRFGSIDVSWYAGSVRCYYKLNEDIAFLMVRTEYWDRPSWTWCQFTVTPYLLRTPGWLSPIVLCGFGVLLLSRRRPDVTRCISCGYSLIGNVSGRCPECGEAIRRDRERRTWRDLRRRAVSLGWKWGTRSISVTLMGVVVALTAFWLVSVSWHTSLYTSIFSAYWRSGYCEVEALSEPWVDLQFILETRRPWRDYAEEPWTWVTFYLTAQGLRVPGWVPAISFLAVGSLLLLVGWQRTRSVGASAPT